jgi:hypothetical protein
VALHVDPQLIPAGLLLTPPAPVPARLTETVLGFAVNVAVTATAVFPATVQGPVPVHAPLQPVKVDPLAAVAVRVTDSPAAKVAVHVVPQLMPAGLLDTLPAPVPARLTDKSRRGSDPEVAQASPEYADAPLRLNARAR